MNKQAWWVKTPTLTETDTQICTAITQQVYGHADESSTDVSEQVSNAAMAAADLGYSAGLRAGLRRGIQAMGNQSPENLLRLIHALTDDAEADSILLEFVKREEGGAKA